MRCLPLEVQIVLMIGTAQDNASNLAFRLEVIQKLFIRRTLLVILTPKVGNVSIGTFLS